MKLKSHTLILIPIFVFLIGTGLVLIKTNDQQLASYNVFRNYSLLDNQSIKTLQKLYEQDESFLIKQLLNNTQFRSGYRTRDLSLSILMHKYNVYIPSIMYKKNITTSIYLDNAIQKLKLYPSLTHKDINKIYVYLNTVKSHYEAHILIQQFKNNTILWSTVRKHPQIQFLYKIIHDLDADMCMEIIEHTQNLKETYQLYKSNKHPKIIIYRKIMSECIRNGGQLSKKNLLKNILEK